MMAWQTWSQMVHLGAPEAACWQDTHVTQETPLSSASASDTLTKDSLPDMCIADTLFGYGTDFFIYLYSLNERLQQF